MGNLVKSVDVGPYKVKAKFDVGSGRVVLTFKDVNDGYRNTFDTGLAVVFDGLSSQVALKISKDLTKIDV